MDALQDRVAAVVARAAEAGEDVGATFDRVGRLADEVAGAEPRPSIGARLAPDRRRPPRLTEPWFC